MLEPIRFDIMRDFAIIDVLPALARVNPIVGALQGVFHVSLLQSHACGARGAGLEALKKLLFNVVSCGKRRNKLNDNNIRTRPPLMRFEPSISLGKAGLDLVRILAQFI